MKKLLLAFLCTVSVFSAHAESDFKVDLNTLDTNKFCVYGQSVYSLGSVIPMGKSERICKYISNTVNGVKPGARWEKV
jgi:hypothetical protein